MGWRSRLVAGNSRFVVANSAAVCANQAKVGPTAQWRVTATLL